MDPELLKGSSIRELSVRFEEEFGGSHHTIRKALAAAIANPKAPIRAHGNCRFDLATEYALIGMILFSGQRGNNLKKSDVLNVVMNGFLDEKEREKFKADVWWASFYARFAHLIVMKAGRSIDQNRKCNLSKEGLQLYIDALEHTLKRFSLDKKHMVNVDEVPCALTDSDLRFLLGAIQSKKMNHTQLVKSQLRTMIPFVGADGTVWMVVMVLKPKSTNAPEDVISFPVPKYLKTGRPKKYPIYFVTTPKGFINNETWNILLGHFAKVREWKVHQKEVLLILDRQSCHLNYEGLVIAKKNLIQTFFLPANTTHWSQPLDNGPNANLKRGMTKSAREWAKASVAGTDTQIAAALEAIDKCLTPAVITASFKNTGIYPFDRKKIEELAEGWLTPEVNEAPPSFDKSLSDAATQACKVYAAKNEELKPTATVAISGMNKCFTLDEAILEKEASMQKKAIALAEKQQKAEKRKEMMQERKQKAMEEREKAQERKEARKAAKEAREMARRCSVCSKEYGPSAKMLVCGGCSKHAICRTCSKRGVLDEPAVKRCVQCRRPDPFALCDDTESLSSSEDAASTPVSPRYSLRTGAKVNYNDFMDEEDEE